MELELAKPVRKPADAPPRPPARKRAPNGSRPSLSIRVPREAWEKLRDISQRRGIPMPDLLERFIGELHRREKEIPDLVPEVMDRVDIIQKGVPSPSVRDSR